MSDLQTFRVHDAVDYLVDDLVVRARQAIDSLDAQLERMAVTRASIVAFLDTVRDTPAPTIAVPDTLKANAGSTTAATITKLAAVPPVDAHICPVCGDVLPSARGLAVHKGLKHKATGWTPEPITKTSVNEQAAREAAARAL